MASPLQSPGMVGVLGNRNFQFWFLQFAGWMGISLISFLSLNLWYNQPEFSYIAHNILQSLLGILLSWPMRPIFKRLWDMKLAPRLCLIVVTVLVFSFLWSVMRLTLFLMLTEETNLWGDFGGWFFPSIFIFLCWTALYHVIKYYQLLQSEHQMRLELAAVQKQDSLLRSEAESLARQAQLKMLRYQLNPHFLFNTMNAISSLVASQQNKKAQEMILQLSHFLRYSLSDERGQEVPLMEEVEVLYKYLQIEQSRFGDRLKMEVNLQPDSQHCLLPGLLLQPLVENAIKYAIAPSEAGGTIRLKAKRTNGWLIIEVEDSGAVTDTINGSSGMGVGLKNIQDRLETLYQDSYSFDFGKSQLGGTCVTIKIPASEKGEVVA